MKPFNLEEALKGSPIVYKSDLTVVGHIIGHSKTFESHMVVEWDNNSLICLSIESLKRDFHMYEEPRPTVTLTLPAPLKEPQDEMWVISENEVCRSYYGANVDKSIFNTVIFFASEEDAQVWLEAMKNSRR